VLAGFPVIEPADFWIGVCKAVGLRQKTSRHKTQDRRKEEEWWTVGGAGDCGGFSRGEGKEAMAAVGLSPMKLRRVLRAELGRKQEATERPLHRSPALRKIFKQGATLAAVDDGSLRPAHLLVALIESGDTVFTAAVTKLGYDSFEVLRELRRKISRHKTQGKRKSAKPLEEDEKPKKLTALERFGRDLTALAAAGALPPLIGRRAELVAITRILLQSRKNNLILIGEPGVGKTGVVEGFAQLMADGSLPEELGKTRVIEISLPSLVAGTKYRGEFEERMEAVIHEASTEPRPILFIDEIHLLLGAGQAGGSMDAANILKPALARGAIRLIGATTSKEYRQTFEKDGALERRFQPLRIEEPTPEEAVVILSALRERLEKHHGVALDDDALRAAVEWSVRYLPDFRLPDKALDLVDQACAAVRFRTLTPRGKMAGGETPPQRPGARRASHDAPERSGVDGVSPRFFKF